MAEKYHLTYLAYMRIRIINLYYNISSNDRNISNFRIFKIKMLILKLLNYADLKCTQQYYKTKLNLNLKTKWNEFWVPFKFIVSIEICNNYKDGYTQLIKHLYIRLNFFLTFCLLLFTCRYTFFSQQLFTYLYCHHAFISHLQNIT